MILPLALSALAQVTGINWDVLPPLPFRAAPIVTPGMQAFVEREVHEGNCPLPESEIRVDVAVLLDEAGQIRAAVPRAIQCASVEQYVAGLVTRFAQNNLLPRMTASEQWYRTRLTFTLPK